MELKIRTKKVTPLCKLLGINEPIIQAPMADGIIPSEFSANVSNAGLLGSLTSGFLSFEATLTLIRSTQKYTKKPFQLNLLLDASNVQVQPLFMHKPDEVLILESQLGIKTENTASRVESASIHSLISLAIEYQVPIISTTFGLLSLNEVKRVKAAGIVLMSTINSLADAHMAMVLNQPDVLIYQNKLAGWHQGGFNQEEECVDTSDRAILLLKKEYPDVLIVKSGAIVTRQHIEQTLRQGFDGVQIGTAFLATKESTASLEHKQGILDVSNVSDTCFSQNVTGKRARGIKNPLMQLQLKHPPEYPGQYYATKAVCEHAKSMGIKDYQCLWAGAGAVNIEKISSLSEYINSILEYPVRRKISTQRMHHVRSETAFKLHG